MSQYEKTTTQPVLNVIKKSIADVDKTIPYRLVGSYEYGKSLEAFTRLLAISKAEELPIYDKILNDRPEFTYFNGAHTALPNRPNLRQADPFQREQFYDSFQREGMAWMMALARVELGATMSMYGNSKAPFHAISTSDYDIEAYVQVLADDAVAHMKSLAQESGFDKVTKRGRPIDTWTLAYLRRLKLIRDMLASLQAIGNAEVKVRIAPYDKQLARYEKRLMKEVYAQTRPQYQVDSVTETKKGRDVNYRVSQSAIEDCETSVESKSGGSGGSPRGRLKSNNAVTLN